MAELTVEIVEGPGAGRQLALDRSLLIGRAPDADLVLEDDQVSRHHARVSPGAGGTVTLEDLQSANGTFVNGNQLHAPVRLDVGDELLIGVTLLQVRASHELERAGSAVRVVPPALAMAPRQPTYVPPEVAPAEGDAALAAAGAPELEKYLDVRVRRQAQLAPLAMFVLIALALIIYFATR
jgi:pSer/pThr/pTyr-binding forkhead associated (FHA) protein